MNRTWICVFAFVCSVFAACPAAYGVAIMVDNAGFEDSLLADGVWDWSLDNQGWGYFDNDGNQGSWNPAAIDVDPEDDLDHGYGGNAPEGRNVGWTNPGTGVPGGFAQVLTDAGATLTAGMTYTLTVEVGNTLSYAWGGYAVQLLAGGTPHTPGGGAYTGPVTGGILLAEDNNTLLIAEDTFETSTVTYTYNPLLHSGSLGDPLQIRLLCLGGGDDEEEVDFDNVTLSSISPLEWRADFTGDWTGANWTPDGGANWVAPAGGEKMTVDSATGRVDVDADLSATPAASLGIAETTGGTVDVSAAGTLVVAGDLTVGSGGTLQVDGTLVASKITSDGTLSGSGEIEISGAEVDDRLDINGVLAPGSSTGTLSVDAGGGVVLSATAEYVCELNGGDTGAFDNDLLSAFDQVTVGGKLSLSALKGYDTIGLKTPTIVESTEWGADGVTGAFGDVPPLDSHLGHGVFFRSLQTVLAASATSLNAEVFQAIAGDAGGDQAFNFADLVQIFGASGAVYGNPAPPAPTPDWTGGDFTGDDAFTFADLVKAFGDAGAHYGAAQYPAAALAAPDGGAVELVYDPTTGQLSIDAGDVELIALSIESAGGLLQITPEAQGLLDGFADVANSGQFAKLDLSGMSSLDFGAALSAMLSESDLLADLTVTGALLGGGTIEDVSLNVVPEPGTILMLLSALAGLLLWWRRRRV